MAAEDQTVIQKFVRFCSKNPFFVPVNYFAERVFPIEALLLDLIHKFPFPSKAIARHMDRHCAKFSTSDEMGANESKHSWYESYQEYCKIIDNSIDLFISKTAGVENPEALIKQLSESEDESHRALLESLIARGDYTTYVERMKEKRATELAARQISAVH